MIRKVFIVAKHNTATYQSLQNSLGTEPDVAIIYDRRSPSGRERKHERRQQPQIDEQIGANGWAVVRNQEVEPTREVTFATTQYRKLRELWRMPDALSHER
jgi:hypothetical protein